MLSAFIPQPQGLARFELRAGAAIPADAIWLDLLEPTPTEEKQVESFLSIDVPTRDEMREIESSNRLYEEDGALYMTATVVTKLDSDLPESTQITFILSSVKLVTNRYVDPLPFRRFIAYAERHPNSCNSPPAVLAGLVEAIVNRVADVIERVATDLDAASVEVFSASRRKRGAMRDFRKTLERLGQNGELISKARESLVSLGRMLTFVQQSTSVPMSQDVRARFRTLSRDVMAMSDHASFLGNEGVLHPRRHARPHQHRPEQHPQDLLGRDRVPAAALGHRGDLRHEFRSHPLAARHLGVLGGAWSDAGVRHRPIPLLQAERLAVTG